MTTSPDVLQLTIKDATTTPKLSLDAEAFQNPDLFLPLNTKAPFTSDPGVVNYELTLGNIIVSVASSNMSLTWSTPYEAFDSFLLEVRAASGATHSHVTTLPGHVRKAEIEGLSPSTQYNITIQGLVEGKRSLPLKVCATTGTQSKYFSAWITFYVNIIFHPEMSLLHPYLLN